MVFSNKVLAHPVTGALGVFQILASFISQKLTRPTDCSHAADTAHTLSPPFWSSPLSQSSELCLFLFIIPNMYLAADTLQPHGRWVQQSSLNTCYRLYCFSNWFDSQMMWAPDIHKAAGHLSLRVIFSNKPNLYKQNREEIILKQCSNNNYTWISLLLLYWLASVIISFSWPRQCIELKAGVYFTNYHILLSVNVLTWLVSWGSASRHWAKLFLILTLILIFLSQTQDSFH